MVNNRERTSCSIYIEYLESFPNYRSTPLHDDKGNMIQLTHFIGNLGLLNTYYNEGDLRCTKVTQWPFNFEMLVAKLKSDFNFDLEKVEAVSVDSIVLPHDFDYSWVSPDSDIFVYLITLSIEGSHKRRYIKINIISGNIIEDEVL